MTEKQRKLLISVLRVTVAVVFIYLAVQGVSFNDQVTITTGADGKTQQTVRLLETGHDNILVRMPDGTTETVGLADVAKEEDGSLQIVYGLRSAMQQTRLSRLAVALLAFAPVPFLQSWRFKMMLGAQDIHLSYKECLRISFAGNFLNFVFLIGSTAGDVYKAISVAQQTPRKTEAVTTILLDRIVGLLGLLIVALLMIGVGSDNATLSQLGLFIAGLMAVIICGAVIATSSRLQRLFPIAFLERLPGFSQFERIYRTGEHLVRRQTRVAIYAVALTMALQFLAIGSGVACAWALSMNFGDGRIWDYFAYIGAGNIVAAVPIAPMGLGTMEMAYKVFFGAVYGTVSQALCLAIWVRLVMLAWALPGGIAVIIGRRRAASTPDNAALLAE